MKSWKTTLAGLGVLFSALGAALQAQFDGDPATVPDWAVVVTALFAAVGLLLARDNDMKSPESGDRSP